MPYLISSLHKNEMNVTISKEMHIKMLRLANYRTYGS
jgi:hypothetical protein